MTDTWQSICVGVCDAMFGWMLSYPRDLTVALLGVVMALVLLVVRHVTGDRALLRRIAADERRLRELIRDTRAAGDHERLARHRIVRRLVAGRRIRAQWIAFGVSVAVLSAIVPWGRRRLEYLPVQAGDVVPFVARFPSSVVGEVAHVVPQQGVTATEGWVRTVVAAVESGTPRGQAQWTFRFNDNSPCVLTVRIRNQSVEHALVVGAPIYETPIRQHAGNIETEVVLTPYRPLGLLPARVFSEIPGWVLLTSMITGGVYFTAVRAGERLQKSNTSS